MNTITLRRLAALDGMTEDQKNLQLETIIALIQNATPDDLRNFEMHLLAYKGIHKNDLKDMVNLRKASFPQTREALLEELKINLKSQEEKLALKYTFALAIFTILGILIAGTIVAIDSKQTVSNFVNDEASKIENFTTNSTKKEPASTSQKVITQQLSMLGRNIGWAAIGIVVAFILWAYGFCGVKGWCEFNGQIDKDLARLKDRHHQIEIRLIQLQILVFFKFKGRFQGDGIFIKYQTLYLNEFR